MRFYILSDLHLGENFGATKACERLKKLCCEIRKTTAPKETVLFVVLGDIANKGNTLSFETATECLTLISDELKEYSVKFEFVPGNHDLEKGSEKLFLFDSLTKIYGCSNAFSAKSTYSCIYDDVNFIFADSTLTRDYKAPGQLDISAIQSEIKTGIANVLFCHHSLSHNYGDEHDTIANGAEVCERLSALNISFLFHGHSHRADITIPTDGLVEVGCGSIAGSVEWMDGVFHQFCVGYIQAGRISCVQRWVDTNDGNGLFAENQLYPEPFTFADPNTVNKELYSPVDEYIKRTVSPYELAAKDSISKILSKEKPIPIFDALMQNNKILLLCDAGIGKSIELQNLAYNLYNDVYFPFLFSLRNYTGEHIIDLIPDGYRRLPANYCVLLFDGYDELTNDLRELFERNLNQFIAKNSEAKIVISSRSNFCKSETSNSSHTFSGFNVFVLDSLTPVAIRSFLLSKGVDPTCFWDTASTKMVSDLLPNPFYLTRLTEIYSNENSLPPKTELMEKLIAVSFSVDEQKFPGNLEEHYRSLFQILEKIAFAMQLMHHQSFDDWKEYQELFPCIQDRNLAKKSGLLKRNGTGWTFLHNNFREYLAARYLTNFSQEKAVEIFSDGRNIKPSWVNTLGYFTGLTLDWDLSAWLAEHAPTALIKFESDRLNSHIRSSVFFQLFCKYEDQQLYFDDALCDVDELAHFAACPEVLDFLLDRIATPRNLPSQYTAVNIIRHFPNLFGRNNEVRQCLLSCCAKYPETHKTVCRLSIFSIYQLGLHTSETTDRLMELFQDNQEDFIRLGMYEYLMETGTQNEYAQFFVSGLKYAKHTFGNDNPRVGNELFELVRGLKTMSTTNSVGYVLKWFSSERYPDFHNSNEVLSVITDTAIDLYKNGSHNLYDIMLEGYIGAAEEWNRTFETAAVKFFIGTDTHRAATLSAATKFENEPHRISCLIDSDPSLVDYLATAYSDGSLVSHTAFQNIVNWYVRDEERYTTYAELIKETDGVVLPNFHPPIDHQALQIHANQEFFDALFSPGLMEKLYLELLSIIGDPNIYTGQLLDIDVRIDHPSALWLLRTEMYHHSRNVQISEFFKIIDLDSFIIHSAAKFITPKSPVLPTTSQKEALFSLIQRKIENKVFENAIIYSPTGFTITSLVPELLSLIQHLDFSLDEETLLHLTEMPAFIFHKENENAKYQYLTSRIDLAKLKQRLLKNVETNQVKNMVLQDHIRFFEAINDSSLAQTALEICKAERDNTILRSTAWKYLHSTLGTEYLCSEVIPFADGEFLMEINGVCKDIPHAQMSHFMEARYLVEPSMYLQAHLISLGSEVALRDYVETIKRAMRPPEGKETVIDGPTVAIGSVTNVEYLPLLGELLAVVFSKEFVDCPWRGLRNTLMTALTNCGKYAPMETTSIVEAHRPKDPNAIDNIRFCNYVINEIDHTHCLAQDVPMSLKETKLFLQLT